MIFSCHSNEAAYVSYAWGDDVSEAGREREVIVNELCRSFQEVGITIGRDKNDVRPGDSIEKYGIRIAKAPLILAVISSKSLRSLWCMVYELYEAYMRRGFRSEEFSADVVALLLDDSISDFDSPGRPEGLYDYWKNWCLNKEQELKKADPGKSGSPNSWTELTRSQDMLKKLPDMLLALKRIAMPRGSREIRADDFKAIRDYVATQLYKITSHQTGILQSGEDLPRTSGESNVPTDLAGPLSLMIQVKDTGESSNGRRRYLLIPELYGLQTTALPCLHDKLWEPIDNVVLESVSEEIEADSTDQASRGSGKAISFASCVQAWLSAAKKCALDLPGVPEVILEFFLPNDLLFFDLCSLRTQSAEPSQRRRRSRPRKMISTCCFIVRSLERAQDQATSRYELEQKWKHVSDQTSRIVVELQGPPAGALGHEQVLLDWADKFFDRINQPRNAVCLYLPDLPAHPDARAEVIEALVQAHLPLMVMWSNRQTDGGDAVEQHQHRSKLAQSLLGLSESSILPLQAEASSLSRMVDLHGIDMKRLSANRMELYGCDDDAIQATVLKAVVIMDVPDRWPSKTVDVRAAPVDRIQSPV